MPEGSDTEQHDNVHYVNEETTTTTETETTEATESAEPAPAGNDQSPEEDTDNSEES